MHTYGADLTAGPCTATFSGLLCILLYFDPSQQSYTSNDLQDSAFIMKAKTKLTADLNLKLSFTVHVVLTAIQDAWAWKATVQWRAFVLEIVNIQVS